MSKGQETAMDERCISACREKDRLGIRHGWCAACVDNIRQQWREETAALRQRAEQAEAERERLRGVMTATHDQRLKMVAGALRSAIDAHGPITKALLSSAAKRVVKQLEALATPARPTEGEAWKCRHCGYMENVVGGDWARAEPRRIAHEAQCPSNPDGPGHPLHGHISPRPSEETQG